jgi:hypothetical protein
MDRVDLDERLDRELKDLQQPRAPHTLLPRVLAAVAQHRPAPATGWFTWSWPHRIASVTAFAVLLAATYLILAEPPATVARAAETAADAATVMRVFREVLFQPLAGYFLALGALFALTCAAGWAVMEFALGGASQR